MGLFSNPRCPRCGGKTVETGYSAPFPAFRCNRCVRENTQRRKDQKRINELEERLKKLESKKQ